MNRLVAHPRAPFILVLLVCVSALPGLWIPYGNIDELTNAIFARFLNAKDMGLADFLGNTYFLTHYLYAGVDAVFGLKTLVPMHLVHGLWKILTAISFIWAGKILVDRRLGTWSAVFYVFASVSFLSKDFHSPTAESFSLLPAVISAGVFFRGLDTGRIKWYFASGFFVAVAALFKAPMGITLAAMGLTLLVRFQIFFLGVIALFLGFVLGYFWPILLFGEGVGGLHLLLEKLRETNVYIQTFDGFSPFYGVIKFFLRLGLVMLCWFSLSCFSLQSLRVLFHLKNRRRGYWQKILFLWLWFFLLAYAVSLGGRVFYHYFVFLLAPLCLLAGVGLKNFDERNQRQELRKQRGDSRIVFLRFVRRHLGVILAVPAVIFLIEGALNLSTQPPNVDQTLEYIRSNTTPDQRIYVWGNVPQLYFFSGRQPSTVYFWSDILAGTSPGSPAMEYVRATGQKLTLTEQLKKDFQASVFDKMDVKRLNPKSTLSSIGENELFTLDELLSRIDHRYWKKVFVDFFASPPELFIDTSPTNIRGFGHTPIEKYELLKRFVLDNYRVEAVIDRMVIYRLLRHQ